MPLLKRLRLYRNKSTLLLLGILFLVILSSGIFLALDPPTYTVTKTIDKNVYKTSASHYAEVEQSSMLFDKGEVTRNAERYFLLNHPEVTITFQPKLNGEPLDKSQYKQNYTATVVVRSLRGEDIIFAKQKIPKSSSVYSASKNSIIINAVEYKKYVTRLREALPRGSEVVLKIEHSYSISNSGVKLKDITELMLADTKTYTVDVTTDSVTKRNTKTVEKAQPSQTVKFNGKYYNITGVVIIGLSGIVLTILAYLVYIRFFCEETIEESKFRYDLSKYNSWITVGQPYQEPTFGDTSKIVQVDSLEGLVNIAIDNGSRVVYSQKLGRFYVYDEYAIYTYSAPGDGTSEFYIGPNDEVPVMNPDSSPFSSEEPDENNGFDFPEE